MRLPRLPQRGNIVLHPLSYRKRAIHDISTPSEKDFSPSRCAGLWLAAKPTERGSSVTLHPCTLRENEVTLISSVSVASIVLGPLPFSEYKLYENFCSSGGSKW